MSAHLLEELINAAGLGSATVELIEGDKQVSHRIRTGEDAYGCYAVCDCGAYRTGSGYNDRAEARQAARDHLDSVRC